MAWHASILLLNAERPIKQECPFSWWGKGHLICLLLLFSLVHEVAIKEKTLAHSTLHPPCPQLPGLQQPTPCYMFRSQCRPRRTQATSQARSQPRRRKRINLKTTANRTGKPTGSQVGKQGLIIVLCLSLQREVDRLEVIHVEAKKHRAPHSYWLHIPTQQAPLWQPGKWFPFMKLGSLLVDFHQMLLCVLEDLARQGCGW